MGHRLPFIKGHMGGNEIVLIWGEVPEAEALEVAQRPLVAPYSLGDNLGLLSRLDGHNRLRARMTWRHGHEFIRMCGGLTQVLGKALVEHPPLRAAMGIEVCEPRTHIDVETDSGVVGLDVAVVDGEAREVVTDMSFYVARCRSEGTQAIELGARAFQIGEYLVVHADDLRAAYPDAAPEAMDDPTWYALAELQGRFIARFGGEGFSLYDLRPARGEHGRAVFPHGAAARSAEPSCGTGSVAIALAALLRGDISTAAGTTTTLRLELGGAPVLGGPDTMTLRIEEGPEGPRVWLSHDRIELLADGHLTL